MPLLQTHNERKDFLMKKPKEKSPERVRCTCGGDLEVKKDAYRFTYLRCSSCSFAQCMD